jgi:hypothetical protein
MKKKQQNLDDHQVVDTGNNSSKNQDNIVHDLEFEL